MKTTKKSAPPANGSEQRAETEQAASKLAFLEKIRNYGGQVRACADARVSTSTIRPLLRGGRRTTAGQKIPRDNVKIIQSIIRLAHTIGFPCEIQELKSLCIAFGIELPNDVGRIMATEIQELGAPRGIDDVITQSIRRSGSVNPDPNAIGSVRLGVIRWFPFCSPDGNPDSSLAGEFITNLFSIAFPKSDISRVEAFGMTEAIRALLAPDVRIHAVFGLLKNAARIGAGITFIDIPGLFGHLGMLVPKANNSTKSITWDTIVDTFGNVERPAAVALCDEVGHTFLVGNCRYELVAKRNTRGGSLRIINSYEEKVIAKELSSLRAELYPGSVVFVAESSFCKKVKVSLDALGDNNFECIDYEADTTPRFPCGIAIRCDATALEARLRFALHSEMFRNTKRRTAMWYLRLFYELKQVIDRYKNEKDENDDKDKNDKNGDEVFNTRNLIIPPFFLNEAETERDKILVRELIKTIDELVRDDKNFSERLPKYWDSIRPSPEATEIQHIQTSNSPSKSK
ncbi:MAG: hypothetical protein HY286_09375 [Planctomycetes bacterium]|nr:hypothetical protein [Planctomycetota bacterium]